eukprot:2374579-Amphidinium_carterae.1
MPGPVSVEVWCQSYAAVTLGRLEAYEQLIKQYATRYPTGWETVYKADVQCRSGLMSRVRMDLEKQKAIAGANRRQISEPCLIHSAGPSLHEQARRTQTSRVHIVHGETYTTNRRCVVLCKAFQEGSCLKTTAGNRGGLDPSKAHQCSRCLGIGHGSLLCTATKLPSPSSQPPRIARAKGRASSEFRH